MGFCITLNLSAAVFFTLGASLIPDKLISIYSQDPKVIEAGTAYLRFLSPSFIPFALSLIFVLTLRSVEKVRLAITATIAALSLNLVLNYLLIFGVGPLPAMGVRGAAIATVISRYTEMMILIIGSYIRRYPPAGRLKELFAFNSVYAARYFRIALPVIFNETLWSLGITIQNLILARSSTEAIAAFNITNTVSQLTWVVFIGLGNGVAVLIGKKIGEGKEQEARDYAHRIVRFAPILSLGAVALLLPISRLLPFIFNAGPEVIRTAALMFIILCCSYPFRAFNMSMVIGICRAGGDTVFCAFYDLAVMWLLALPLGAAAGFLFHAPAHLIYLCLCMEEPAKVLLGMWRLKTGKWLHNVVN
jgi:putative MATE family efflux protein